ncbi:plasmid pRiA4b ORF-3 family protein [Salana multivorans]
MPTLAIRAEIVGSDPLVWRELRVPADYPLDEFHHTLQAAVGWHDAHLYLFARGEDAYRASFRWQRYPEPSVMDPTRAPDRESADAVVGDLFTDSEPVATYEYDFGDAWSHSLHLVEMIDDDDPRFCVLPVVDAGERAAPPEDAGGIGGLNEYVDWAEGRIAEIPGYREQWILERLGVGTREEARDALATFDLARAQQRVALQAAPLPQLRGPFGDYLGRTSWRGPDGPFERIQLAAARLPDPLSPEDCDVLTADVRWFLDRIGPEGLRLTQAGYLPMAEVVALAERFNLAEEMVGRLNREDHTPQVGDFREALRELGLARPLKGRLVRTRLGTSLMTDPVGLTRHIIERLPLGRDDFARDAGTALVADLAAQEPREKEPHPARGTPRPGLWDELRADGDAVETRLEIALGSLGWSVSGEDDSPHRHLAREAHRDTRPLQQLFCRLGVTATRDLLDTPRPTPLGARFLGAALGLSSLPESSQA